MVESTDLAPPHPDRWVDAALYSATDVEKARQYASKYAVDEWQIKLLSELLADYARSVELERYEECCKAVCWGCICEYKVIATGESRAYLHKVPVNSQVEQMIPCAASSIRSLPRFAELRAELEAGKQTWST